MSKLYKRKVKILIGELGSEGVELEGLRFSFSISMDDTQDLNTGEINIYNLSEDTLGYLEKEDSFIILQTGYGEEPFTTIFIGDNVSYKQNYTGTDIITNITCKDGYTSLNKRRLSLSFKESSNTLQILNNIINQLNLLKSDYSNLPNYVYNQGFSHIGTASSAISKLTKRIGYEWVITNNALIITKPNESNNTSPVQLLTYKSGLIGKPLRLKENEKNVKSNKEKLVDGWLISCNILPGILPKSIIKVETDNVNGNFYIKELKLSGDTYSNSWNCEMKTIKK